jgi:hypothetical protein
MEIVNANMDMTVLIIWDIVVSCSNNIITQQYNPYNDVYSLMSLTLQQGTPAVRLVYTSAGCAAGSDEKNRALPNCLLI